MSIWSYIITATDPKYERRWLNWPSECGLLANSNANTSTQHAITPKVLVNREVIAGRAEPMDTEDAIHEPLEAVLLL